MRQRVVYLEKGTPQNQAQIFCPNLNMADSKRTFLEKPARCKSLFSWPAQLHGNQMTGITPRVPAENWKLVLGPERGKKTGVFPSPSLGTGEKKGLLFTKMNIISKLRRRTLGFSGLWSKASTLFSVYPSVYWGLRALRGCVWSQLPASPWGSSKSTCLANFPIC